MSGSTALREEFLQNLRLHLIDLSRRLEQDPSDDVVDYVLYRLQLVASHLSRIAGSAPGNVFEDLQHSLGEVTAACIHCFVFYGIGWSTQV